MTATDTTVASIGIFLGPARVDCPACGEEHVTQRYSWGRYGAPDGGRAFCEECVEHLVPNEEREIVELLNNLDVALWFAESRQGVGEKRMRLMLMVVATAAKDLVVNYTKSATPEPAREAPAPK